MELEPLLDATDGPCPRCKKPLECAPGEEGRVHECPRCGGIFVRREALAEILAAAEVAGAVPAPVLKYVSSEVTYVSCPLCHTAMNRTNFGKMSGVIVDVCKKHGTWFDAGELTRVVSFVSVGGLAKARAREVEEKRDEAARAASARKDFVVTQTRHEVEQDLHGWEEILTALFRW